VAIHRINNILWAVAQLFRIIAIDIRPPNVEASRAVGNEDQIATVRCNSWVEITSGVSGCQRSRVASIRRHYPQALSRQFVGGVDDPVVGGPNRVKSPVTRCGEPGIIRFGKWASRNIYGKIALDRRQSARVRSQAEAVVPVQVVGDSARFAVRIGKILDLRRFAVALLNHSDQPKTIRHPNQISKTGPLVPG
jgi:hypothetical protein